MNSPEKPSVLPVLFDKIPSLFYKDENCFTLAKLEHKKGEWKKEPFKYNGSSKSSSNDSSTCMSLIAAKHLYEKGGYDYLWASMSQFKKERLAVLDVDYPQGSDEFNLWYERFKDKTYCELSPSKRLRIIFTANVESPRNHAVWSPTDRKIELYTNNDYKFASITGNSLNTMQICDLQEEYDSLIIKEFKPKSNPKRMLDTTPELLTEQDVEQRLKLLIKSKDGASYLKLINKDLSSVNNDDSRADWTVSKLLAFWLSGDAASIEKVLRKSKLVRSKWDTPRGDSTYIRSTITNAIADLNRMYRDCYERDRILPNDVFQHIKEAKSGVTKISSIENFEIMLQSYGVHISYDEILKKEIICFPEEDLEQGYSETSTKAGIIESLCHLNGLNPKVITSYLPSIAHKNRINRVLEFITSTEWDGIDRVHKLVDGIHTEESCDKSVLYSVVLTWLIQCVAAADSGRNTPIKEAIAKYELVLVLVGAQGIKKTSWIKRIVPKRLHKYIMDGLFLDTKNKDSIKTAISYWITELGELDSTFDRSSISQIKAFLSQTENAFRLPYGRLDTTFPRNTSFFGTVNHKTFLQDITGSRRFAPIPVTGFDLPEMPDEWLAQLWAQLYNLYIGGQKWWFDINEVPLLDKLRKEHTEASPYEQAILSRYDLDSSEKGMFVSLPEIKLNCGIPLQTKGLDFVFSNRDIKKVTIKGRDGYHLVARSMQRLDD